MQIYTYNLSNEQVEKLGLNWAQKITNVIDQYMINSNPHTVSSKMIQFMGDTPMKLEDILTTYNVLYGQNQLSQNYCKLVVSKLHKSGHIKRVSRGVYVKNDVQ